MDLAHQHQPLHLLWLVVWETSCPRRCHCLRLRAPRARPPLLLVWWQRVLLWQTNPAFVDGFFLYSFLPGFYGLIGHKDFMSKRYASESSHTLCANFFWRALPYTLLCSYGSYYFSIHEQFLADLFLCIVPKDTIWTIPAHPLGRSRTLPRERSQPQT